MRVPASTYRLQFNPSFGFADARRIVPYLRDLGVGDMYASPLFAATKGSVHGYDVTDPTRINPELGGRAGFTALRRELSKQKMGLLLDIVPNHMAATPENPWWRDVLEHGRASRYTAFFDIDWDAYHGRLLLPVLGDRIERCLERGEIRIEESAGALEVVYYDNRLPLDPATYRQALEAGGKKLTEILRLSERVPARHPAAQPERAAISSRLKRTLAREASRDPALRRAVARALRDVNSDRERLSRLLEAQAYALRFWRRGSDRINYRRFFDITGLAGVRVEDPEVMEATHSLVRELVERGDVTGLRIDHVDGLRDPAGYLRELQRLAPDAGGRRYVVVEKILVGEETLPADWPVSGTTGYDFLRAVNDLFVDAGGLQSLSRTYRRITGRRTTFEEVLYRQKKKIIRRLFRSEVAQLTERLESISRETPGLRSLRRRDARRALLEVAAAFPVYRTYVRSGRVSKRDASVIRQAVREALRRGAPPGATRLLGRVLSMRAPERASRRQRGEWLEFVLRFQQFTGPVMAKGQEDTAFYTYNPLRSLNEVGSEPVAPADPVRDFHRHNERIRRDWPHTMTSTSTHDTKRSEDARARIDVLSEMPDEWEKRLVRWRRLNRGARSRVEGRAAPDANEEVLLYQALLGAWPLHESEMHDLSERVKAFLLKAAREAKTNTSWRSPNPEHEQALEAFVGAILDDPRSAFRRDFEPFAEKVQYWGHVNSLAQTVLKIASPGVPDVYRGCETWDFSLVDPDNRRPVDFRARHRTLDRLKRDESRDRHGLIESLVSEWRDGRIKLYVTWKGLSLRREETDLFLAGSYEPLRAPGERRANAVAFLRGRSVLAIAPRLLTSTVEADEQPFGKAAWGGSALTLPEGAPALWRDVFTGEPVEARGKGRRKRIALAEALGRVPVALLRAE